MHTYAVEASHHAKAVEAQNEAHLMQLVTCEGALRGQNSYSDRRSWCRLASYISSGITSKIAKDGILMVIYESQINQQLSD